MAYVNRVGITEWLHHDRFSCGNIIKTAYEDNFVRELEEFVTRGINFVYSPMPFLDKTLLKCTEHFVKQN